MKRSYEECLAQAKEELHRCRMGDTLERALFLYDALFYEGISYKELGTGERETERLFKDALTKALVLCRDTRTTERQYVEVLEYFARDTSWRYLLGEIGSSVDEVNTLAHAMELKCAQRALSYCRLGRQFSSQELQRIKGPACFEEGDLIEFTQEELDGYLAEAYKREAIEFLERARGGSGEALLNLWDRLDEASCARFGNLTPEKVGTSATELKELKLRLRT